MARIIKSSQNSEREQEALSRSRIIGKDIFSAQQAAREMFSQANNEERARLETARERAEQVEQEAYQTAMESVRRACISKLFGTYRDLATLLKAGEREVRELSQEIIRKIAGDSLEIPENTWPRSNSALRVEASSDVFPKLMALQLPSWIEPCESIRADPGKLIIETDTFMIQCSFEEIVTCILPYNTSLS